MPAFVIIAIVVPLLIFAAILTALAPKYSAALVLGLGVAAVALVIPLQWLLITILFMAAVVGGGAEYFLNIGQANWLPFILATLVGLRAALFESFKFGSRVQEKQFKRSVAWFWIPVFVYIFTLFAAAVVNFVPLAQLLASVKNYLLMWGVLIAFLHLNDVERTSVLLWRWVLVIAALQLPVVLIQRFFIASKLTNSSSSLSFDAINGTFGGGLLGGRSGALTMFLCIAIAYILILWRDKRLSAIKVVAFLLITLPTMFFVEVKAVVIWLPLVAGLVFSAQIKKRPVLFVLGTLASLGLAVSVILVYRYNYYASSGEASIFEFFSRQIEYIYDPNRFNAETRELGRVSALVHWWSEMDYASIGNWLIGYGPGASRGASSIAVGEVAKRYSFYIDISAATTLLWDVGVMGALAFASILIFGAIEARRLSKKAEVPMMLRGHLDAASVGLILILSSTVYVRDAVDGPIVQFMIFFFLGLVVFARKRYLRSSDLIVGNA